jgi:SAM-dependent methyltransferase
MRPAVPVAYVFRPVAHRHRSAASPVRGRGGRPGRRAGRGWPGMRQDAWVLTSLVAAEAELLRGVGRPCTRVLDAGCGRRNSRGDSLAGLTDEIELLVGVDLDERAGRENQALDRFVVADLCGRTPFEDSSFDLVYATFVVEHLSDPHAAFREWRRLLRPGGSLLVTTPNISNPFIRLGNVLPQRLRIALKRIGPGSRSVTSFPRFTGRTGRRSSTAPPARPAWCRWRCGRSPRSTATRACGAGCAGCCDSRSGPCAQAGARRSWCCTGRSDQRHRVARPAARAGTAPSTAALIDLGAGAALRQHPLGLVEPFELEAQQALRVAVVHRQQVDPVGQGL